MRSQSSIEFLSTYGFVFLVIGIAIALIFFVASYNSSVASTQCTSFGGLNCNFVGYYPNATYGYGIVELSITNAQTAPINITGVNITIGTESAQGICAPSFMYQGQEATCTAALPISLLQASTHTGTYEISAGFCVSPSNEISPSGCSYLPSNYTGSFRLYSASNDTMPFSVIVAYVPSDVQLPALPSSPYIHANYLIAQNGDIVPSRNLTGFKYEYSTCYTISYGYSGCGSDILYPSSISDLNSNTLTCSPPYTSVASVAYSSFYMPASAAVTFNAMADNAIEIYYKQKSWPVWVTAFGGSGWNLNMPSASLISTNTLSSGYYQIAVEYMYTCGGGFQDVSVNGIGQ